ncbi:MAG: low affinity iron permease family protein [Vampirovibrionales bacterium]
MCLRVCPRWCPSGRAPPQVCFAAVLVILVWGLTGPLFHFSDTWQLVINTSTTIVTFLMVFLIQNTQNRESEALHLKIDELIRSNDKPTNRFKGSQKTCQKMSWMPLSANLRSWPKRMSFIRYELSHGSSLSHLS